MKNMLSKVLKVKSSRVSTYGCKQPSNKNGALFSLLEKKKGGHRVFRRYRYHAKSLWLNSAFLFSCSYLVVKKVLSLPHSLGGTFLKVYEYSQEAVDQVIPALQSI